MDILDAEELMDAVLGLTDEQVNDEPDYDDLIFDKFGVDVEQFVKIASELMNFTMLSESPITKVLYQGYVVVEESRFICKQKYSPKNK